MVCEQGESDEIRYCPRWGSLCDTFSCFFRFQNCTDKVGDVGYVEESETHTSVRRER
jgi:hypothetical protein